MKDTIRQLIRSRPPAPSASTPAGERVYAIGDIHGTFDLFAALISAVNRDNAARGPAQTTIILLGDLVDRGPDSAAVVAAARALEARLNLRFIAGNHEEMFLQSFHNEQIMRHFLRYGGWETILSYGVDPAVLNMANLAEAMELMRAAVPEADREFIARFEDHIVIGDYLFVHAGIRPGTPLAEQELRDLRWIREPFLSTSANHGHVVVHGHSISDDPEIRDNRIGIDTGAFMSGRLTALGLEGTERWLIEAHESAGVISLAECPA